MKALRIGSVFESASAPSVERRVLDSLSTAVVSVDRHARIVFANRKSREVLEVGAGQDLLEPLQGLGLEARYQDWQKVLIDSIRSARVCCFDQVAIVAPGGDREERLVNILVTPLVDVDGVVLGATVSIEDITDRVSLEKRLAVSERLASVGKLAAKVAHELNNPLDGILRYISLASRACKAAELDKPQGYLDEARQGLLRMVGITAELLEFSRCSHQAFELRNLNELIELAFETVAARGCSGLTVERHLDPAAPDVSAGNLFQVLCNLIKNAIDAMEGLGTLTLVSKVGEEWLEVVVRDSGPGIPPGAEKRIFEPFYTTKDKGKGTGLGLAVCQDVVARMDGQIWARNQEQGGCEFGIRIPHRKPAPQEFVMGINVHES